MQSAIDEIQSNLGGQITTIVIAHRLSTIRNADNILVMQKGKLVEQGNHNELLKNYPKGIYADLISKQESAEAKESKNPKT